MVDYLVSLLKPEDRASGVIHPFNAVHSHDFRKRAMHEFLAGSVRVLICTDAAGMVRVQVVLSTIHREMQSR